MIRDWQPHPLTRREVEVLRGLAGALYDPHDTGKIARDFPAIIEELEAWLTAPDAIGRAGLRALLLVIELSPARLGFGLRTMTSLAREERLRYVTELEARQATCLDVWKSLLGTAYFSLPSGAAELRTSGPVPGARLVVLGGAS
jgi:hypothetical protein